MRNRGIAFLVCACMVLVAAAPAAFAQSATEDAYEGLAAQEDVGGSGSGAAGDSDSGDDGSLPFTGLGLSVIVLAGVALVGGGFAVRRVSRGPTSA